jgi:hypothetical protein
MCHWFYPRVTLPIAGCRCGYLTAPPGTSGTMMRTGFDGKPIVWAWALPPPARQQKPCHVPEFHVRASPADKLQPKRIV